MNQENNNSEGQEEKVIEPEVMRELTSDEKTMAILAHALAIIAGFVAPMIIYLVKKEESSFIEQHARESLNFQLLALIAFIALIILNFLTCGIAGILFIPLGIVVLIFCILAAVKASNGEDYKYPINLPIIPPPSKK